MTRFTIGLLLGLLLGIAGASAFLITAGGGDYFVAASPRIRELETSLKNADQDRDWLRKRLNESHETMARLESRFMALTTRFETLGQAGGAEPSGTPTPAPAASAPDAAAAPTGPGDPS